jgi:hemerythrin-like domain-containing protein
MYMIHTMFRREFALLPALVRDADGDENRSQIVADHIDLLATILHAHHHSEDVNLWPKLLDRGSQEVAPIIHLMEDQHEGIERISAEVTEAITAWRGSPASETTEALGDALDRLVLVLNEHMGMEEDRVLPMAEKYVTEAEWQEMASGTGQRIPQEKIPLVFGMSLYEGDPDVIKKTLSRMPPEVRSMLEELGPKAFTSHSELVHGTATPRRSTS